MHRKSWWFCGTGSGEYFLVKEFVGSNFDKYPKSTAGELKTAERHVP